MPDVRMNYQSMEKMGKEFGNAANQIKQSISQLKKIAGMMDDGALKGQGGVAFQDAIQQQAIPKMQKLAEKMTELQKDINGAVVATRDGVETARKRFV